MPVERPLRRCRVKSPNNILSMIKLPRLSIIHGAISFFRMMGYPQMKGQRVGISFSKLRKKMPVTLPCDEIIYI
jgi:hypothetical protein